MKTSQKILIGIGGLVLVLVGIVGIVYVADIPIQATVIDTQCSLGGTSTITIKTEMPIPGIVREMEMSFDKCSTIRGLGADGSDAFVKYYPKSERTVVYEGNPNDGGKKVYDSG